MYYYAPIKTKCGKYQFFRPLYQWDYRKQKKKYNNYHNYVNNDQILNQISAENSTELKNKIEK